MFVTFRQVPSDFYGGAMSENVRFYRQKMDENRAGRRRQQPLSDQLREIFAVVADCERRWAVEDRIERQLGRD